MLSTPEVTFHWCTHRTWRAKGRGSTSGAISLAQGMHDPLEHLFVRVDFTGDGNSCPWAVQHEYYARRVLVVSVVGAWHAQRAPGPFSIGATCSSPPLIVSGSKQDLARTEKKCREPNDVPSDGVDVLSGPSADQRSHNLCTSTHAFGGILADQCTSAACSFGWGNLGCARSVSAVGAGPCDVFREVPHN